jgi:hypothetical protein
MAANLEELLDRVETAHEGEPITPDYHNSLKAVVEALVLQGGRPTSARAVLALAPAFLPHEEGPNWVLSNGVAKASRAKDADGNEQKLDAHGWMPVQLPDGARIQSMTVRGRRDGDLKAFAVALIRAPIAFEEPETIIGIALQNAAEKFEVRETVKGRSRFSGRRFFDTQDSSASEIEDLQRVENNDYVYFVVAVCAVASENAEAVVGQILVEYSRPSNG